VKYSKGKDLKPWENR